jgi:transposase
LFERRPRCLIGVEACVGAHQWERGCDTMFVLWHPLM